MCSDFVIKNVLSPRHILITGASSGIGAALAQHYADEKIQLTLLGRNTERLQAVASACEALGSVVKIMAVDIRDASAMHQAITQADDALPIDCVIANAGISGGPGVGEQEAFSAMSEIFRTNVDGVLHTILPLLPRMIARGDGHIALMSSLAGFFGIPNAPAYSASKNAVRALGEGLRGQLAGSGVRVSVICPGYIRTPMTQENRFPMPFLMHAPEAAQIIARGLGRNRAIIAFPWPMALLVRFAALLPGFVRNAIFGLFPDKT